MENHIDTGRQKIVSTINSLENLENEVSITKSLVKIQEKKQRLKKLVGVI